MFEKLSSGGSLTDTELSILLKAFEKDDGGLKAAFDSWSRQKWSCADGSVPDSETLERNFNEIKAKILASGTAAGNKQRRRTLIIFERVAAVLFVPLAVCFALYLANQSIIRRSPAAENMLIIDTLDLTNTQSQVFYSPAGTRSKIVLKDSTVVWLNSSSRLTVNENFGRQERRVSLSGQGYFDVTTNKVVPFIVDLGNDITMKVTGTTFSVKAYDDEDIETVLIKGSVELDNGRKVYRMHPSERVVVDRANDDLVPQEVDDDESYKSWKDGIIVFRSSSMTDVVKTLERWYNVDIMIKDSELMSYRFTARLDNCSLEQVFKYISLSSPVKYSIDVNERTVTLSKQ